MSRSIASLLFFAFLGFAAPAFAQTSEADALLTRADELDKQGNHDLAIVAAQKAVDAAELAFGRNGPQLVKALKTLARLYEMNGRTAEAAATYRRAFAILERAHGDTTEIAQLSKQLDATVARKHAEERFGDTPHSSTRSLNRRAQASQTQSAPNANQPAPPPSEASSRGLTAAAQEPELGAAERGLGGAASRLPSFPWPPPASSARYDFPQETFKRYRTVGEVSDAILDALRRSGYVEYSFFQTGDGGVALVTRLEKIANDGTPAAEGERWPAGFNNDPASFIDFVRGLFYAKPGHYRVIVFVLQEASFTQSHDTVTGNTAEDWLRGGANKLPPAIRQRPFGKDSTCTALIYEFASDGSAAVKGVVSALTGRQHLQRAGLLAVLEH
jgi:tetratricopeptide (TPR) repeat protein